MFFVTIVDKDLRDEPDVGVAIIEADSEEQAVRSRPIEEALDQLIARRRCRCVAYARPLEIGRVYRARALVKPEARSD